MHWLKKTGMGIGALFALLLVAGFSYQEIAAHEDAALRPPASQMVSVNGHKMHIFCMGKGPRIFLLEAGHGDFSIAYHLMQPQLAKVGRVCAYDRAGLGWSDWVDGGYDAVASADQLAALVKAAKINTPFVYFGHSYGANVALVFASRYPQDVSGLILADPASPKGMLKGFHGTRAEAMAAPECGVSCYLMVAAAHLGVTRLMTRNYGGPDLAKRIAAPLRACAARPATAYAAMASWGAFPKTAYETQDAHLGAMPLLIILSTDATQQAPCRGACIQRIAAASTRTTGPVFIPNSTHSSLVIGKDEKTVVAKIIAFADTIAQK